ncbi:serine/threonine-protein kinase [Nocardia sp. NPDC059240]|uniref:serine/threonine-protein kinase n=1 Tax=Nocardia sp. NPDC059240 TaxID=3346786 RepID=UPI003689F4FE
MRLDPGADFSGFGIERVLGAGGMGVVYLARHPRLDRHVALKVFGGAVGPAMSLDSPGRARFDREAALAARLEHPDIVPIYDRSAPGDEIPWLCMRYISGGDIAALLDSAGGRLPAPDAVRLITDAGNALDYAHRQGVLHRDVKPANILVDVSDRDGGRAVLTDFGIARAFDDTLTLTGTTATVAYAAPERFGEDPADHRADIYSLGCTFYEILTGSRPFPRSDHAAVISAHLTAPPPRPTELFPDLPPALDDVIATALAKLPADRYPNCAALADAAHRALAGGRSARVTPTRNLHADITVRAGRALDGRADAAGDAHVVGAVGGHADDVVGGHAGDVVGGHAGDVAGGSARGTVGSPAEGGTAGGAGSASAAGPVGSGGVGRGADKAVGGHVGGAGDGSAREVVSGRVGSIAATGVAGVRSARDASFGGSAVGDIRGRAIDFVTLLAGLAAVVGSVFFTAGLIAPFARDDDADRSVDSVLFHGHYLFVVLAVIAFFAGSTTGVRTLIPQLPRDVCNSLLVGVGLTGVWSAAMLLRLNAVWVGGNRATVAESVRSASGEQITLFGTLSLVLAGILAAFALMLDDGPHPRFRLPRDGYSIATLLLSLLGCAAVVSVRLPSGDDWHFLADDYTWLINWLAVTTGLPALLSFLRPHRAVRALVVGCALGGPAGAAFLYSQGQPLDAADLAVDVNSAATPAGVLAAVSLGLLVVNSVALTKITNAAR